MFLLSSRLILYFFLVSHGCLGVQVASWRVVPFGQARREHFPLLGEAVRWEGEVIT